MLQRNPPSRSFRPFLENLQTSLNQGLTLIDAVEQLGNWAPSFDLALLRAGEKSGRLDVCFKLLADYYHERAVMVRHTIGELVYPAFVFHFAVVLFPFLQYFQNGTLSSFLIQTLGILLPIYAALFLVFYACQGRHGLAWRGLVEKSLHWIPLLGKARRELALARLSAALESLLNAGVPILSGWELAAAASGSPALMRAVASWKEPLQMGQTPAELVAASHEFPELFANLYHTGEVSGQLDQSLKRLHQTYMETGSHTMRMIAQWTPRAAYAGVALLVGAKVLSFFAGYFRQLDDLTK